MRLRERGEGEGPIPAFSNATGDQRQLDHWDHFRPGAASPGSDKVIWTSDRRANWSEGCSPPETRLRHDFTVLYILWASAPPCALHPSSHKLPGQTFDLALPDGRCLPVSAESSCKTLGDGGGCWGAFWIPQVKTGVNADIRPGTTVTLSPTSGIT